MWNYRIVRKKHAWKDPRTQEEKESYLYGIHETYYDKAGNVGAITENPVKPYGETIKDLRHSWMMMAEAFGKPLLDYDHIPDPGYIDEAEGEHIEFGEITREPTMQEKLSALDAELEKERVESEQQHQEFVGIPTLKALLGKIFEDYENKQDDSDEQNKAKYDFSKGRRGAVLSQGKDNVRITIRLDRDILDWFRSEVEKQGGGSYQSMINDALRKHIEHQDQEHSL